MKDYKGWAVWIRPGETWTHVVTNRARITNLYIYENGSLLFLAVVMLVGFALGRLL